MNFKIFFFLIVFLLSSFSHAQWFVDGGNVIWPYGKLRLSSPHSGIWQGDESLRYWWQTNWYNEDAWSHSKNIFNTNYLSAYGASIFSNIIDDGNRNYLSSSWYGNFNFSVFTAMFGDTLFSVINNFNKVRLQPDSGSVYASGQSRNVVMNSNKVEFSDHLPSNFTGFTGNEFFIEEKDAVKTDTLSSADIYGYLYRFGSGNKYGFNDVYSFYSNLNDFNASLKITGSGYHFYGKGDYPSYFGGATIQKVYTFDVENPPHNGDLESNFGSASSVGPGFTAYIDDNAEHTFFYQVVSDGSVWWVFTADQAP